MKFSVRGWFLWCASQNLLGAIVNEFSPSQPLNIWGGFSLGKFINSVTFSQVLAASAANHSRLQCKSGVLLKNVPL